VVTPELELDGVASGRSLDQAHGRSRDESHLEQANLDGVGAVDPRDDSGAIQG
jgi:hypothetical protein